jgi:hypothetical protein
MTLIVENNHLCRKLVQNNVEMGRDANEVLDQYKMGLQISRNKSS